MQRTTISVSGMACDGCEQNVETAVETLDGVNRVEADHTADTVEVVRADDVADDDLHAAIERAGYDVSA
ncbi:heavy-metal-associated domain-containing protein [Halosegnis sp.]|uniref:heavy-metal-associated domain-containing protein n=1 Tax=Halosegnis sp. TaxID=2864959 RepID=UPI0035D49BAF